MTRPELEHRELAGTGSPWFPRPQRPADILAWNSDIGFSPPQIYALLGDPAAREGQCEVDATSSTRLLYSRGWVFKANTDRRSVDLATAQARTARSSELMGSLGVWHPLKTWFILHAEGYYWPCSLTPRLVTLQDVHDAAKQETQGGKRVRQWGRYLRLWSKAICLCVKSELRHRLHLGLESDNFGFEQGNETIYYVDDEVYYFDLACFFRRRCIWGLRVLED